MAQLSLLVAANEAPITKWLAKLGLGKGKLPPVVEVVIDPDTEQEQQITLQPQKEAHLIPLTPGHHVVAVYDPDREKHLEGGVKANGIAAGLSGFALGAALGGNQSTMDLATKGFSKVLVGDPVKRWQKAFERHSVKEFDVQEGETVSFGCQLDASQGIVCLTTARSGFWSELLYGFYLAVCLACVLGLVLKLDVLPQLLLFVACIAVAVFVVWRRMKKREERAKNNPPQR